jgi:hypothetical protein
MNVIINKIIPLEDLLVPPYTEVIAAFLVADNNLNLYPIGVFSAPKHSSRLHRGAARRGQGCSDLIRRARIPLAKLRAERAEF